MRQLGPLARKMLTMMAVATVVPTLAVAAVSFLIYRSSHIREIERQQQILASLAAERLSVELQRVRDALFTLSRNPVRDEADRFVVAVQLAKNVRTIDGIFWLDETGAESFRWERRRVVVEGDLESREGSDLWRAVRSGRSYIGPVTRSGDREPVVTLGVPGVNPGGIPAVGAVVELRALWDLAQELELHADETVYVIDETGRLIGHDNPALVQSPDAGVAASLSTVRELIASGETSSRGPGLLGEEVLMATAPIPGTGWMAVAETPVGSALSGVHRVLFGTAAVVVVVLSLAGFYVFDGVERIARPIQELTLDSVRLAGTGAEPVFVDGDELDALRANFRRMRARLSEKERRLTWAAKRLGALHELERSIIEGCPASDLPDLAAGALERAGIGAKAAICGDDCALERLGLGLSDREHLCPCDDVELRTVSATTADAQYVVGSPLNLGAPYRRVVFLSKSPELHDPEVVEMVERLTDVVRLALDRLKLEESLDAERRLVSTIVADAPTIIVALSNEGTVLSANEAIQDIVGIDPAEVVGKPVSELPFIGLEASVFPPALATRLRWESTQELEDGDFRVISWTASSRADATGAASGLIAIGADVSEQRRLETRLRLAQKMEAVGQLAGGIAHDFNNLLTVITGYGSLLLSQEGMDERTTGRVEQIAKAGERAAGLTHQLLAFSRRQVMNPRILQLNVLLSGLKPLLARVLEEDIEVAIHLFPELWKARADPAQIEQVVLNLAINARDAMPSGGTLRIATANREITSTLRRGQMSIPAGCYASILVQDTGLGMDATTRDRVFEPFFTTKEPGKGTGLGLSSAYGIVKQSGGYILIDSEPGVGTTFEILLPRAEGESAEGALLMPTATRGSETVLVVEDDSDVRRLAVTSLEQMGYQVLEAEDGLSAISVAEGFDGEIDLLLSDAVMPRMSGPDLATRLTSLRPAMKVLLMSGYLDRMRTLSVEGLPFLEKPFTPTVLGSRVRQVLDQTAR